MQMAPGFSQCLQPRGDVHPVPKYVVLFSDYVSEVDADAEPDPSRLGHIRLTVDHSALDLDRTPDGIDYTRKFREQTVAGVLYDAAAVLGDFRIDHFAEMSLQAFVRALLIGAHQPRVTDHVGSEDCGKAARRGHSWGRPRWSKGRLRYL
jgi:hypothetical protein